MLKLLDRTCNLLAAILLPRWLFDPMPKNQLNWCYFREIRLPRPVMCGRPASAYPPKKKGPEPCRATQSSTAVENTPLPSACASPAAMPEATDYKTAWMTLQSLGLKKPEAQKLIQSAVKARISGDPGVVVAWCMRQRR